MLALTYKSRELDDLESRLEALEARRARNAKRAFVGFASDLGVSWAFRIEPYLPQRA